MNTLLHPWLAGWLADLSSVSRCCLSHSERRLDNMQPLGLCVFLALIAVLRCYELSQNLAEFYCVLNGNFNDRQLAEKYGASQSKLDFKFQPVFAPSLSARPVMYLQELLSGVLERALYMTVRQGDDGTIYMKPYNFTGNAQINPATFDANQAKNLTPDDLQGNSCSIAFTRILPFVFTADWETCRENKVQGKRPSYVTTNTCKNIFLTIPVGAHEQSTHVPYVLNQQGLKYPLENAPSNYVCNCDNTST